MTSKNTSNKSLFSLFQPNLDEELPTPNNDTGKNLNINDSINILNSNISDYSEVELYQPSFDLNEIASDPEILYPNEFYREQVNRTGKTVQISKDLQASDYHKNAAEKVNISAFPQEYLDDTLYKLSKSDFKLTEPSTIIRNHTSTDTSSTVQSSNNTQNEQNNIDRSLNQNKENSQRSQLINKPTITSNSELAKQAFTDITTRSDSSIKHNIYIPISNMREIPESFQQYLFSRNIKEKEEFTDLLKIKYKEQTNKPLS